MKEIAILDFRRTEAGIDFAEAPSVSTPDKVPALTDASRDAVTRICLRVPDDFDPGPGTMNIYHDAKEVFAANDRELRAMAAIVDAMRKLDEHAQSRVMAWALARFVPAKLLETFQIPTTSG